MTNNDTHIVKTLDTINNLENNNIIEPFTNSGYNIKLSNINNEITNFTNINANLQQKKITFANDIDRYQSNYDIYNKQTANAIEDYNK